MTETPVESLEIVENSLLSVGTPKGRIDGDKFLFTIPSFFVSNLLEPFNKHLATSLSRIEYFGAVCTIIESRVPFGKYYWLNVADPGFLFGGVIEHTNMVDPKHYNGSHIAYLSRYFAHDEPLASQTTSEIESRMMHDVQRLYPHITDACVKSIHTFRTSTAATVCDLNFSLKIPQCRTEVGGLYLATMAHIYPDERSVNNSIRVASEACAVMDLRTPEVPVGHSLSAQVGFGVRDR
jgi:protoporphyrinogen oxidase